jgi:hypothetical protein
VPIEAAREPCCERCGSVRIVQRILLPGRVRCTALARVNDSS